jgi:hypothetical protein
MPRKTRWPSRNARFASLIAILVSNFALIGIVLLPAQSAQGANEIYGYSCCGGGFGTVNYHPGETVKLVWITTPERSSGAPAKTVVLSASASGPFSTLAAAKKAISESRPASGRTNFAATTLHVSDEKAVSPVAQLHVPPRAAKGFYELTFKIVKGKNSAHGGLIFTVKP